VKLHQVAIITTALVIITGLAMVFPLFLRSVESKETPVVMLCFLVQEPSDYDWCEDLSILINSQNIKATVFITGKVADQYPYLISLFNDQVDIGSMTYGNTNLTAINDYSLKLEEVKRGKLAVDLAGSLFSRAFYAPFSTTDDDIYSILSRSDIIADFSYSNQFNVYVDGQFIKYSSKQYTLGDHRTDFIIDSARTGIPLILSANSTSPLSIVEKLIIDLKEADIELINGSDLTGFPLTIRGDNDGHY